MHQPEARQNRHALQPAEHKPDRITITTEEVLRAAATEVRATIHKEPQRAIPAQPTKSEQRQETAAAIAVAHIQAEHTQTEHQSRADHIATAAAIAAVQTQALTTATEVHIQRVPHRLRHHHRDQVTEVLRHQVRHDHLRDLHQADHTDNRIM